MKPQENDFYQSVLEMNLNPTRRNVNAAVNVGLKQVQDIAERCYWANYLNPLDDMLGDCLMFRHGIITGYEPFVKYKVNEDLSNLVLNTELMLGLKHDLIHNLGSDSDVFDRKRNGLEPIYESTRTSLFDSLFYRSVLMLDSNSNRNDVTKSYLIGIDEAQKLVEGIYSAGEDSEFRLLAKNLINWRYAHISGYEHFMKYGLHNNLSGVVSETRGLLQSQKKKVRDHKMFEEMKKRWEEEEKEEQEEENGTARK